MTKEKTSFYKWELLILLWFAFFFKQADRQLFNIVLPHIKADLGLSDVQAGTISSIFILTIGIFIRIAAVGYLTWASTFLYEKYNYPLARAGFYSMIFYHAGAFTEVLLGGKVSDDFGKR